MSDEQVERIIVTVDDQHLSVIQSVVTAKRVGGNESQWGATCDWHHYWRSFSVETRRTKECNGRF